MGKQEGKKLTKTKNKHQRETASPTPSEGGDVRGNGGIRKEGMCLAGYGMKCVEDIKGWRKRSYRVFIHLQKSKD
ncbi:MAG: hypothetical protein HXN36_07920 [Prevotella histicola]|uniref:hypothetical protein n=1 Tax=Prevotella histicola TaxID=470565 RepID=UPI001CB241A7|nr:hypothetical protein [Prevotella histicola]MBF1394863.1 hypothetical protein [Prevotella histicola]